MLARPALDEIRANAWIPRHVGAEQDGEETLQPIEDTKKISVRGLNFPRKNVTGVTALGTRNGGPSVLPKP